MVNKDVLNKYKSKLNDIKKNIKSDNIHCAVATSVPEKDKIMVYDSKATLKGRRIILEFKFNLIIVEAIKKIEGRKYDVANKIWSIPLSVLNINAIKDLGFEIDTSLKNILKKQNKPLKNYDMSNYKTPKDLSLLDFQINTLQFIEGREGKALVALDMGLGKSVIGSTYINNHPEFKPILLVVPATLKYNWRNEIQKWVSRKTNIQILEGKTTKKLSKNSDIIIINYDILNSWVKEIEKIKPELMILDESHYCKSRTTKRTKAVMKLAKKIKHIISLSGTPATNRPAELYTNIKMIEPNLFASFNQYAQKYCDPKFNGFGWEYKGASNVEELHQILSEFMIRYKKEDVLTELPDKQFSFVPLDLTNKKEYEFAENDFIGYIKATKGNIAARRASYAETLTKVSSLRQLAVTGALKYSIQWIKDFLESTDEKIVVFCIHRAIIDSLMNEFGNELAVKIDGSVKNEDRQKAVDRFQNDDTTRVFIGQTVAAGVGITLTRANNLVFLELPWVPGEILQCQDRIHRIGQKNSCNIYYLLAENTIEMTLAKLLDKKINMLSQVLDGKEVKEEDTLSNLLGVYEDE